MVEAWKIAAWVIEHPENWKLVEERYDMRRDLVAQRVTSGLVLIYEEQVTSAAPRRVAMRQPGLEMPMTPYALLGGE